MGYTEIIEWSGRCPSPRIQKELCEFLNQLAKLSQHFYKDPPKIRYFNNYIQGKIIIDTEEIFSSNSIKYPILAASQLYPDEVSIINALERDIFREIFIGKGAIKKKWLQLKKVHVYGIEFHLYDGSCGDKVNFIFLSHDKIPELNGEIVTIRRPHECVESEICISQIRKQADYILTRPSFELKCCFKISNWFYKFLGWVKYFFIPNLYFQYVWIEWGLSEDLPSYEEFKDKLDREILNVKDKFLLKKKTFRYLIREFKKDIKKWENP